MTTLVTIIGVVLPLVAAVSWALRFVFKELSNDLKEHTKAANRQAQTNNKVAEAVNKNTKVTETGLEIQDQTLIFLKSLNGKLTKAAAATAEEVRDE
jgi:hypothetical protein